MPQAKLTSRERVNRMFTHQDQDRIPRYDSYWDETLARWEAEGLAGATQKWGLPALDLLGSDIHPVGITWPSPFPGQKKVLSKDEDTQVIRDTWGAIGRFWKHKSGTPEHIGFDCDSREKWEAVYKPAMQNAEIQVDLDEVHTAYAAGRKAGKWCHWFAAESFEVTRKMIGDEIILMAMVTDPDWVCDVSQTYTDQLLREFEAINSLGLDMDGVFLWGDMAYNRSTVCSPAMYQDLIWPDHKRIINWVHEHDMKLIYHTDGNVNGVVELFIEAGFDCLQPLEAKASMDIRALAPHYGEQLSFMGNINVMTMITNDRELIEQEIKEKFAAGMATNGYCYHSDHSVPPQVSLDTYRFIIACIDKYGNYS